MRAPPALAYERLRSIVDPLKAKTRELTGKRVTVGTTFDPGPESAESDFKYRQHREINKGNTMGAKHWVHCAATLHGDEVAYAGYPNGIPEGTTLGTCRKVPRPNFLSRRAQRGWARHRPGRGRCPGVEIFVEARQGSASRIFAASRSLPGNGRIAWRRGALSVTVSPKSNLPIPDDPRIWFHSERLMRWILAEFGYHLRFDKPSLATADPLILAARCRGAWCFSGYSPSTRASLEWRFPEGVPIPIGCDVEIHRGFGRMSLPRAWHRECRVLVEQGEPGEISCHEKYSGEIGVRRRLAVSGLKSATVTFLPDSAFPRSGVRIQRDEIYRGLDRHVPFRESPAGHLIAENISGKILIAW